MPRGVPVKTPERVMEARWLHDREGWTLKQIGDRYGVSDSAVCEWLTDPAGARRRAIRESYARVCVDCGGRCSGGHGRGRDPERCDPCAREHNRIWTKDAIKCAIQEWAATHGEPPGVNDWNGANSGRYPSPTVLEYVFGSWNAGIRAAGYTPRPVGHRRANPTPAPPA